MSDPARDIWAKGVWDGTAAAHPFRIERYLCKRTGRTLSHHPEFSHVRKRYTLSVAVPCIVSVVTQQRGIGCAAKAAGVEPRTLRRWMRGWIRHEQGKRLVLCASNAADTRGCFAAELLTAIRAMGCGSIVTCVALAMSWLMASIGCPLY
jgi:transposase-like protein